MCLLDIVLVYLCFFFNFDLREMKLKTWLQLSVVLQSNRLNDHLFYATIMLRIRLHNLVFTAKLTRKTIRIR